MAAATTNNSEDDKFNEELHWCINYLELKLPKVGEKQGISCFFLYSDPSLNSTSQIVSLLQLETYQKLSAL